MRAFWASLVIVFGLVGLAIGQVPNTLYSVIVNALPVSLPLSGSGEYLAITQGGNIHRISPADLISNSHVTAAACDATTDVAAVMQSDMNTYSAAGGGQYLIPTGKGCVISGADLSIPYNIQVLCTQNGGGYWPSGNYAAYADFLISSSRSIKTVASAEGGRSGVFGCAIVRQGYTAPTSLRTAITVGKAFLGTALVCTGATDVTFQDNLIVGFATAISTACDRFNARRNRIDSTDGIVGTQCSDTCYIKENEVWPFANPPYIGYSQTQDSAISAVADAGGLFKVTLTTPPAVPLITGDVVVVHDATGAPTLNNRWTITVIDATNFTLDGSTFAGGYGGSGVVFLTSLRTGTAFSFGAGQFFGDSNLVFGWDRGVTFTTGNDGSRCTNCWIDGWQVSKDPTPIGVLSTLTSANSQYSGFVGAPQRQVLMDGTSPGQVLQMSGVTIVGTGVVVGGNAVITVSGGALLIAGGLVAGTPTGANWIYIANAANNVRTDGVTIAGGAPAYQTTAVGCGKLSINGVTGPCAFTPTLVGDVTPGTLAYTKQDGNYTASTNGVDVMVDIAWAAVSVGPTGANTMIETFPLASGQTTGVCSIGFIAAMALTAGTTLFTLSVPAPAATFASFEEYSSAGVGTGYNPALIAPNGRVQAHCHYLQ